MNAPAEVIICIGSGGVGKTTVAAMLGLHHAALGKKTLIITLDPAKRLMDALSLKGKGETPKKVAIDSFGVNAAQKGAALFALMPDIKKEWLDFLQASIERESIRKKIASNHFYHYMAEGLPGAFEIICSHVLFRVIETGQFDTIILDTPPTSHSISFFDVPNKVSSVLNESIFQRLMKKRNSFLLKLTKNLVFFSGGFLQETFERLIGSHFLSELIDCALTIDGLYAPMLERAHAMDALLKDKKTRYVMVARPTLASVKDCLEVTKSLQNRGISIHQVLVNQVSVTTVNKVIEREWNWLEPRLLPSEMLLFKKALQIYQSATLVEQNLITDIKSHFKGINVGILTHKPLVKPKNILSELVKEYEQQ